MNATERLRQLLDERGVEYKYRDMFGKHVFHWGTPAVNGAMFTDGGKWTELVVENPTPEQAVEATLGRETCKVVGHGLTACDDIEFHWYALSCGHRLRTLCAAHVVGMYCPECGRRVAE